MASDAVVYLLPTPKFPGLQDLVYCANMGVVLEHIIQSIIAICTLIYAWYAALVFKWELEYILLAEIVGWLVCLCLSWSWFRSGLWDRLKV